MQRLLMFERVLGHWARSEDGPTADFATCIPPDPCLLEPDPRQHGTSRSLLCDHSSPKRGFPTKPTDTPRTPPSNKLGLIHKGSTLVVYPLFGRHRQSQDSGKNGGIPQEWSTLLSHRKHLAWSLGAQSALNDSWRNRPVPSCKATP